MAKPKIQETKPAKKAKPKSKRKQFIERMNNHLNAHGPFIGEFKPEPTAPELLKTTLNRVLNESLIGEQESALTIILREQVRRAKSGDTKSAELLLDRAFGKPVQTVVASAAPVVEVKHNVINIDEVQSQ